MTFDAATIDAFWHPVLGVVLKQFVAVEDFVGVDVFAVQAGCSEDNAAWIVACWLAAEDDVG